MKYLIHFALAGVAASTAMDRLAGYQLGTLLSSISDVGFLTHSLSGGETLKEACSSDGKTFLSLGDDPWSRGRLAYISLERVDDARCSGQSGVPTVSLATKEGLRVGDAAQRVIALYGQPTSTGNGEQGVVMRYKQGQTLGRSILLAITTKQDVVQRIALGLEPNP